MSEQKDCAVIEKELRGKILNIRNGYEDVLDAFAAAKKEKMSAKERYSRCIDSGSEAGMKDCLKTIRECNAVIESLPASREEFFGKLEELENDYKDLMRIDQQNISKIQAVLDQAKKDLTTAKTESLRIHGIRIELNSLKSLIVESGKSKTVSEDNTEI